MPNIKKQKQATFSLLLLILLLVTNPIMASTPNSLSLSDCIKLALKQNPDILSAVEDKHSAQAQTDSAWSSVFPKLSLEAGYNKMHSYQQSLIGDSIGGFAGSFAKTYKDDHPTANLGALNGSASQADSTDAYSIKLSAQQILFSGSVFAAIKASQYGVDLADTSLSAKANNLTYTTKEAYINALKADEIYLSVLENKKLIEQLIDQTQSMITAGLATRSDLLKLQLSLKNIEQALIGSESATRLTRQQLYVTIGVPLDAQYTLETILTNSFESFSSLNVKNLTAQAAKQRKELSALDYQIKLYQTQIAAIASAAQPMILAVGSYGYQNTEPIFGNSNRDWLIGVNAKWTFYDGKDTEAKVDNTQTIINKLIIQKNQLLNGIDLEINAITSSIHSSIAKIGAAQKELELARENVDIAKEKYTSGLGTNLELINAQTSLITAQTNLINAEYDFELAKARLYKATGETEKI